MNVTKTILIAVVLAATAAHAGTVRITPKAAFADSYYENQRKPGYVIDSSGIDETTGTHTISAQYNMWMGKNTGNTGDAKFAKWFVVDLGAVYVLDSMKIWNFNMNNGNSYASRGVKQIDIYVSTNDADFSGTPTFSDTTTWTLFKENHSVGKATGTTAYTGDSPVSFNSTSVRWVGFWIDSLQESSAEYGGLSEVRFWALQGAVVSLEGAVSVTSSSAATLSGSVSNAGSSSYPVQLVYGTAAEGDDPSGWSGATEEVSRGNGSFSVDATGLSPDTEYQAAFALNLGSEVVYSSPAEFSTATVAVQVPVDMYESDPVARSIVFMRPASASTRAVSVAYSLTGTAVAGTDYVATSGTAEFAAGETTASVTFTPIDNQDEDGTRTVVVTVSPGPYVSGATASFSILDDEGAAVECVWTGAGADNSWNNDENWSNQRIPTVIDTATFTDVGLAAGETVTIDADSACRMLTISRIGAMTFGGEGSLLLGGITRIDLDGTEGNHTLSVPLKVFAPADGKCVLSISGSGSLRFNSNISKQGTVQFWKVGAGLVDFCRANNTWNGTIRIYGGSGTASASHSYKGTVEAGGGETSARFEFTVNSAPNGVTCKAYTNGYIYVKNAVTGEATDHYVYDGGRIRTDSIYWLHGYLTGGTIEGGTWWTGGYGQGIRSYASSAMAEFKPVAKISSYYDCDINVENGPAIVDLLISGPLQDGGSGQVVTKKGAGVVKATGNNSFSSKFTLSSGTWYVDNTEGYGLGQQETTVSAGARLGGTGCVGMKDVKSYATLVLSNGSESNYATLSPGTIDETTGEHIYGTFKSGRESAHNRLTLGNWAHLEIGVGPKDPETKLSAVDKLMVYGNLEIGSNCTLDLTTNSAALDKVAGGTYTIVEADAITGTFATITKPKSSWKVAYVSEEVDNEPVVKRIVLTIPDKGLAVFVR